MANVWIILPAASRLREAAMRQVMEAHVHGVLGMVRAFAPVLARSGGGTLVNEFSVVSRFTVSFDATYRASKHAALTLGLKQPKTSPGQVA